MSSFFRTPKPAPSITPSPPPAVVAAAPSSSSSSSSAPAVPERTPPQGEYFTAPIPSRPLAFTNNIYLAPSTYDSLKAAMNKKAPTQDTHVVIRNMVFTARPHESVRPNEVAIGARHRVSLGLAAQNREGDSVPIKPFYLSKDGSMNLTSIELDLELLDIKRKILIKESEMIAYVKQTYGQQVFTKGQVLVMEYMGVAYNLVVKQMEAFKPMNDDADEETREADSTVTVYVDRGVFLNATTINFNVEESKTFKFERSGLGGHGRLFRPDWKFEDMGIGGLDAEFSAIFRRAFASRVFPPEIISELGIQHVKGMLLFGPPGTGKTLIARQIGKMLSGREPIVVNGPEVLNKYVGASEENVRKLFQPAEEDYAANKEHADLHIIIFDEIDAICKVRGSTSGGTGVQDTVVNQLLTKLDGVNALPNILVIGMTNRKDMLDPALLRPGRLEVHIEIPLPNEEGRRQILTIHTKEMKAHSRLGTDVDIVRLAELTKNFSGAELLGLVKSASSFSLDLCIDTNKGGKGGIGIKEDMAKKIQVSMNDFYEALKLKEVQPAFGVDEEYLKPLLQNEMFDYGVEFKKVIETTGTLLRQIQSSSKTRLMTILLEGAKGSGTTTIAAQLARDSSIPFVKLITPEKFVGKSEAQKTTEISIIFEDAYKSSMSLIIIDNIERLLEYVQIGPRFSNSVLQTLLVLVGRLPPKASHRLIVVGTTSDVAILQEMQLRQAFNVVLNVPQITKPAQVKEVFRQSGAPIEQAELDELASNIPLPIPIKTLLLVIEMAKQDAASITAEGFAACLDNAGFTPA